jgi:hypothetical protein
MASKITDLTSTAASASDEIPINRGGADYKITAGAIASLAATSVISGDSSIYVNSFYPAGVSAHDGTSHPLSELYSTLGTAQAYYPHATSLTDEFDWCAWQAATNYIYDRDRAANGGTSNFSGGTIRADGNYLINKTVVFNHAGIRVLGENSSSRFALSGNTSISYNGSAGTEDDPVYMFDFYIEDESGNPPPGRVGNSTLSGGGKFIIENITFAGNGGSAVTEGSSHYVSGILLRKSAFSQIINCNFGNGLYDGIVNRAPALFLIIARCMFYATNRDGIGIWNVGQQAGSFSTTIWIRDNEFGYCGRYALLMDLSGSVEAFPIVSNNSIEHTASNTFFATNPEWFVHGVYASFCYINCGNLVDENNRFEGTAQTVGVWGDYHLIGGTFQTISKSTGTNLILSSHSNTQNRSDAAITYATARKYLDITDQRNYRLGVGADIGLRTYTLTLRKIYNLGRVYSIGGDILGTSGYHNFEEVEFDPWVIPTKAAVAREGYVVDSWNTAIPTSSAVAAIIRYANVQLRHMFVFNGVGGTTKWSIRGLYRCVNAATAGVSDWAASTVYYATWLSTGAYRTNRMLLKPTTYNGFIYRCTVSGTSGTSEPSWPTTIGSTVVDGGVTWECFERCYALEDNLQYEECDGSRRTRSGTAAPTTGQWYSGDKIKNINPTVGGNEGWVCINSGGGGYGIPGTWYTYGQIGGSFLLLN